MSDRFWTTVTPSAFSWEKEALDYVRAGLPDHEPFRAWSNFEFVARDGSINEVDLLVVSSLGFFLVEIKSWPGTVYGDQRNWTVERDGKRRAYDNPLFLTNLKCKRLRELLERQGLGHKALPRLNALVFLSDRDVNCRVDDVVAQHVVVRDEIARNLNPRRPGVIERLRGSGGRTARSAIDERTAGKIAASMRKMGIKYVHRERKVGDYKLAKVLREGDGFQDWRGEHVSLEGHLARVRVYNTRQESGDEARRALRRAAEREFRLLQGIQHPGILSPRDFKESEFGPALVFDHVKEEATLDHHLQQRGSALDLAARIDIVRQVAEGVRYAHDRRLIHRALSPRSVLVIPKRHGDDAPRYRILDWQLGARDAASSSASPAISPTVHGERFLDTTAHVYFAPEARTDPKLVGEHLDIFSLGALAYFVFSGEAPAASEADLLKRLRRDHGLQLAAVVDGALPQLCELILTATAPDTSERYETVDALLEQLDKVEAELARPDDERRGDPADARPGDLLPGGYRVLRRLGKGATAVAFLVEVEGEQRVLKLALDPSSNERLADEGKVLAKLHHANIVHYHDTVDVEGHAALVLDSAGERTLARLLREEGRVSADLLQRYGDDLLQAVEHLEQTGYAHRDIKPDNIGITALGRGDRLRLVLFDFSLSRVPPEETRAGTRPYLDPFLELEEGRRWDPYAERYAAAVTLYEMATTVLPRWGSDGKSDPAVIEDEATIESELIESSLREPLTEFFTRALRRNPQERFDNAEQMLRAWREACSTLDKPVLETARAKAAEPTPGTDTQDPGDFDHDHLADAPEITLDSLVVSLGLSPRAVNACERVEVFHLRDLLTLSIQEIQNMRGVGNKTRRELKSAYRILAKRFPPEVRGTAAPAPESTLGALLQSLVPASRGKQGQKQAQSIRAFLGLDPTEGGSPWPGQREVAESVGVTPARIGQLLAQNRRRWAKLEPLATIRDELVELLGSSGGVMAAGEIEQAIESSRNQEPEAFEAERGLYAHAVTRAALETERGQSDSRWSHRRAGTRLLVALEPAEDEPKNLATLRADYAIRLGDQADQLAAEETIAAPARVMRELRAVPRPPEVAPLSDDRLLKLAVAASTSAALSSRLEIYPRGMSAERAIRLGLSGLLGGQELGDDEVRHRIRARYPEAEPLPERPELDGLLETSGWPSTWDETSRGGRGAYRIREVDLTTRTTGSSTRPRLATGQPLPPDAPVEPTEVLDARAIEERLTRAASRGRFLVLSVPARYLRQAEEQLERRYPVDLVSVDRVLLDRMKSTAAALGITDWSIVLRADAADAKSPDGQKLRQLLTRAFQGLADDLGSADRTVVLTRLGLLARYDMLHLLEPLAERVGAREHGVHGAWLLVAGQGQTALPLVDGKAIGVHSSAQHVRLHRSWVLNVHRAADPTEAVS